MMNIILVNFIDEYIYRFNMLLDMILKLCGI